MAVVPVILFHAGVSVFAGGFVGVDVFFVISGYLITGIIFNEMRAGTFSIARFYERRIRRIFPALFAVMLACIPFALAWMTPGELEAFSRSLIAVPAFVSNVLFWREGGYFAATSELKPLLHTWSLAVEEQFYVVFPLLLLALRRASVHAVLGVVALLTLGSMAFAEWAVRHYPGAAFYALPVRAWELGAGAIVALSQPMCDRVGLRAANAISTAGICAVIATILLYDEGVPFPGLWALPPVLGAALIIAFGRSGTLAAHVLSWRPMVAIGLLSYSAYLWHQPLFAFAHIRLYQGVPGHVMGLLIGATFALAYLSWRYIERPFRQPEGVTRRQIFVGAIAASVAIAALGLGGTILHGLPSRLPVGAQDIDHRIAANTGLGPGCIYEGAFSPRPECVTGAEPSMILWGDSFAMHLADGLRAANPERSLVQATMSLCGPFRDIAPTNSHYPPAWADNCLALNRSVVEYILRTDSITDVVMASTFDQYTDGRFSYWTGNGTTSASHEQAVSSLLATVDELRQAGKRVWVVSPPAIDGSDVGLCVARAVQFGDDIRACDLDIAAYERKRRTVIDFLIAVERAGVSVSWLPKWTCRAGKCLATVDGALLYRDYGHLSRDGSRWFGERTPALTFPPATGEHAS